ncbi:hypothetical protein CKAH01_08058 [Colletotrichum kahawae]|uniref:Fungal N-terminal domain-containing protein n=1 Tax=Colletotrichum kahawae TaxID=34407 RepID=A0AAD9Y445_COLKA|nr:hypothetical protein CKAH01_08058 [Colletotrichum kahawae]
MDPLSITSAAVSLAGVVFTVATKVKEISDTLTNAPQAIWDIADEVLVLQAVLKQVERLVKRDPNSVERLEIDDVFKLTVKGCHATLLCISKEYFTRFDWKARILALWKHGEMEQLLLRLARKKADLGLFIEMLNLQSNYDVKDVLAQNQPTLDTAKQDLRELVPIYPSLEKVILESLDGETVDSILGDKESLMSTTVFEFDAELLNTRTYRRRLAARGLAKQDYAQPPPVKRPNPLDEDGECAKISCFSCISDGRHS